MDQFLRLMMRSRFGKQAGGYILGTVYGGESGITENCTIVFCKHASRQNTSLIVKYKGLP
jgi:hypothetical protein